MDSKDPADSVFRDPKGRSLLSVPNPKIQWQVQTKLAPSTRRKGVLKSPETPARACVRRALWAVRLLANILFSCHRGSKNYMRLVILWHLCRLRLLSRLGEPHQWWWAHHLRSLRVRLLHPVPDRRGNFERGWLSTLIQWLRLLLSWN